jgi:hypothetical protein
MMPNTPISKELLLTVLSETAAGRLITAEKAAWIVGANHSGITGLVISDPEGNVGIVDKAAVRWLSKEEMRRLMHGPAAKPEGSEASGESSRCAKCDSDHSEDVDCHTGREPEGPQIKCPHCGTGLLWSEDRGAHCDGCDNFDPEADLLNAQNTARKGKT